MDDKMLKVLEVNVDDHLYGGVYVLVRNTIRNLPKGIKADVAALEPFDDGSHIEELKQCGSSVYYVGSDRNKLFKQLDIYRNVKKLVDHQQYDVVHIHSDVSHKLLVSALASKAAGKIILHSHSNDADGGHIRIRRAFHRICRIPLRWICATYIATSADAAKWMFPWADSEDVIILDNGIDYQRYRYKAEKRVEMRKELGIKGEFLIGMFGRFVPPKNHMFALGILQSLLEKDQNIRLLCIGEGPLKGPFICLAREKGLERYIRFVGNTDRIEDYYQAIDALIMPSCFEGFGLVSVESQISGTPTFVSDNVPVKTRISNVIHYLPVHENAIPKWRDGLIEAMSYTKHDISAELDGKYELRRCVDRIASIYGE